MLTFLRLSVPGRQRQGMVWTLFDIFVLTAGLERLAAGGRLDATGSNQLMSASTHSDDILVVGVPADIAQLVERNLAKVEVAGSSPVVRSKASCLRRRSHRLSAKA